MAGGRLVRELVAPTLTSLPIVVVSDDQTVAYDASAADNLDTEGNGLTYSLTGGADVASVQYRLGDWRGDFPNGTRLQCCW